MDQTIPDYLPLITLHREAPSGPAVFYVAKSRGGLPVGYFNHLCSGPHSCGSLFPQHRSETRKTELDTLESRLLARIEYHKAEMRRLGDGWDAAYDWEDPADAYVDHLDRRMRLEWVLGRVRWGLR
jgi:hypothetical protein